MSREGKQNGKALLDSCMATLADLKVTAVTTRLIFQWQHFPNVYLIAYVIMVSIGFLKFYPLTNNNKTYCHHLLACASLQPKTSEIP